MSASVFLAEMEKRNHRLTWVYWNPNDACNVWACGCVDVRLCYNRLERFYGHPRPVGWRHTHTRKQCNCNISATTDWKNPLSLENVPFLFAIWLVLFNICSIHSSMLRYTYTFTHIHTYKGIARCQFDLYANMSVSCEAFLTLNRCAIRMD